MRAEESSKYIHCKFPNDVPKDFVAATLGWPFFLMCLPAQHFARCDNWGRDVHAQYAQVVASRGKPGQR
jgi:hypothetical protein